MLLCDVWSVWFQMFASLFLSCLFTLLWTPTAPNVLQLPRGEIFASFDHWTINLPIETRTSWTFATKLEYRIRAFKTTFSNNFAEHRQQIRPDLAERLWKKFERESEILDRELNVTLDALQHLKTPNPPRTKRSLLPFVGDALSSMFGTATTDEIHEVLSRINDLSDDRDGMLDVLDNTVTVLNQTIADTIMNRQTINRLTNLTT